MINVCLARIDDRLIHGQVMAAWIKQCDANEVVIVDDELSKDTFLVMMMKSLIPEEIGLKVFNEEDAQSYLVGDSGKEKILILVKAPKTILSLVENGVKLNYLNIGGMGMKSGRAKLFKNIAASDDEKIAFRQLVDKGLTVQIQVVPTEKPENVEKYL